MKKQKKNFFVSVIIAGLLATAFVIYASYQGVPGVIIGPTPKSELKANEDPEMLYAGEAYYDVRIIDKKTGKDTIVHAVNTAIRTTRLPGQRVIVSNFMNGGEYLIKR